MDALRSQIAALARGPAAIVLAHRADINELEKVIDAVSIAGLVLGLLAGLIGVALFTSGISGRVTVAAANAGRLGEGQPLKTMPGAADELAGWRAPWCARKRFWPVGPTSWSPPGTRR